MLNMGKMGRYCQIPANGAKKRKTPQRECRCGVSCNHGKMELGIMLAVEALAMSMGIISIDKSLLETGFDGGNAGRILADRRLGNKIRFLGAYRSQLVLDTQQGEDQGHTHIHAELYLKSDRSHVVL